MLLLQHLLHEPQLVEECAEPLEGCLELHVSGAPLGRVPLILLDVNLQRNDRCVEPFGVPGRLQHHIDSPVESDESGPSDELRRERGLQSRSVVAECAADALGVFLRQTHLL